MNIRNPKQTAAGFECEIDHSELGWIPFHATADDKVKEGREIYQRILNGEAGEIAPYEPENDSGGDSAGDPNQ